MITGSENWSEFFTTFSVDYTDCPWLDTGVDASIISEARTSDPTTSCGYKGLWQPGGNYNPVDTCFKALTPEGAWSGAIGTGDESDQCYGTADAAAQEYGF